MMTPQEFDRWCDRLKLPDRARKLITQIRESQPVRIVQGNRGNLRGNYSSNKMGRTIQFESHRGELAHIIDGLEHNPDVIEYYDQPSTIELNYLSKSGKKVRSQHTPDFFTISTNWVGWEEFKFEESLIRESEDKPNRYTRDVEGNWRCPPGEEYAKSYELNYRFVSSTQLNSIRVRIFPNQELATAYEEKSLALSVVSFTGGVNHLSIEVGAALSWDGQHWEIANYSPENIYLKNTDGKIVSLSNDELNNLFLQGHVSGLNYRSESPLATEMQMLLSRARDRDAQTANEKYDAIKPYLSDNAPPITKVSRSIRRWRDDYLSVEQLYGKGNGYQN